MSRPEPQPMTETQRARRGHDFLPPDVRATVPGRYAQEDTCTSRQIVHAHYFSAAYDLWATEIWEDEETPGRWWAFGYARFAHLPDDAEWGSQSLNELEQLNVATPSGVPVIVERDLTWTPMTVHECVTRNDLGDRALLGDTCAPAHNPAPPVP